MSAPVARCLYRFPDPDTEDRGPMMAVFGLFAGLAGEDGDDRDAHGPTASDAPPELRERWCGLRQAAARACSIATVAQQAATGTRPPERVEDLARVALALHAAFLELVDTLARAMLPAVTDAAALTDALRELAEGRAHVRPESGIFAGPAEGGYRHA